MTVTDSIADMLTRIRNALRAKHSTVVVPASRLKRQIVEIMRDEGFITKYSVVKANSHESLEIVLKYAEDDRPVIHGMRRISKPGRRVYASVGELPRVLNGLGIAVISTPRGILTDSQCREKNVGGEVLCYIW